MKTVHILLTTLAVTASTSAIAQRTDQLKPFDAPTTTAQSASQSSAVIKPQASAPPLTSVAIYAVGSTQYGGYEYTYGDYTTTGDHGGAQLRVAFEEWGYGQGRVAKFNGAVLPSSANYLSQPICGGTPASPNLSCPAGSTAIGFLQYYNLDGNQSGTFQAQSTSINTPIRTYSTSIVIR